MDPRVQEYLANKYQLGLTDEEKQLMSGSEERANSLALSQGMMEAANTLGSGISGQKARPLFDQNAPYQSSDSVRKYIMDKMNERRGVAKIDQEQAFKSDELNKKLEADKKEAQYKADMKGIEQKKLEVDKADKANRQTSTDTQDLIKYRDGHDVTKQTNILVPSYKKVTTAAAAGTAAGDMGVIFGYMKMQDPLSSVREGEYATAQNAAGIPERLRVAYNKAVDGQILDPKQRADFVARAKELYDGQMSSQAALDEQIMGEAKNRGLDPNRVIINPWKVKTDAPAEGSGMKPKTMKVMRAKDLP
jgi:hypothetical protein